MTLPFKVFVVSVLLLALGHVMAQESPSVKLADPLTPDGKKLLFAGPLPVTVKVFQTSTNVEQIMPGDLLMITEKHLYFRKKGEFQATIYSANAKNEVYAVRVIEEVVSTKGINPKQWGPTNGGRSPDSQFIGTSDDARTGRVDSLQLPPLAGQQLEAHFYFSLLRLQHRTDAAFDDHDDRLLDAFKDRGKDVAKYLTAKGLNKLAAFHDDLGDYIEAQRYQRRRIEELKIEYKEKLREFELKQLAKDAERNVVVLTGAARNYKEGGSEGLATIGNAFAKHLDETIQIERLKKVATVKSNDDIAAALKAIEDNKEGRYGKFHEYGIERFRMRFPKDSPFNPYEVIVKAMREGQFDRVRILLEEKCKADRLLTDRDNPFALADASHARAEAMLNDGSNPERGEEIFRTAVRLAQSATSLPEEPIYDFDRVDLYRHAASIASFAVFAESKSGVRAKAFSPRALFAVRLLDSISNIAVVDTTGQARAQRALCLMLSGRFHDAVEQSNSLQVLQKSSMLFWYNLARMHAARSEWYSNHREEEASRNTSESVVSDRKAALEALSTAIRHGFSNVGEVYTAADFYGLVSKGYKDIDKLIAPRGKVTADRSGGFSFTNQSPYTMTNVELRSAPQTNPRSRVQTSTFATALVYKVLPGETVKLSVKDNGGLSLGSIEIQSDQTLRLQNNGNQAKKTWMKLASE